MIKKIAIQWSEAFTLLLKFHWLSKFKKIQDLVKLQIYLYQGQL